MKPSKVLFAGLWLLVILFCLHLTVRADDEAVPDSWSIFACVSYEVDGLPYIQFGYTLSGSDEFGYRIIDELVSDHMVLELPPAYFYPGTTDNAFAVWGHDGNVVTWAVTMLATGETQSLTVTADSLSECHPEEAKYGSDGGWVEITKCQVVSPFHWEIWDGYNWHYAADETPIENLDGQPCTRLVLGHDNSNTDPENYRIVGD